MNADQEIKQAARERLFDAVLADAVAAEEHAGPVGRGRFALVAAVLLAALVTVGVALLRGGGGDEAAQDPEPFDPLFPRVERRFHRDRSSLQLRSVDRVRSLPEGTLPPVAVLPGGPAGDGPVPVDVLDALLARGSVRSLVLGGDGGLPRDRWRAIAGQPELEELNICCDVDADDLRELRHAPRLRALAFGKARARITPAMVDAVLELPHVDCLSMLFQQIDPQSLGALSGLPNLRALYLEGCSAEPGWLDAIARIETLRWLGVAYAHYGLWKRGALTADDLGKLANLPKLASLTLVQVDVVADAYEALPESLVTLSVYEAVPAAALRGLLARPRLRGLSLGDLDEEARAVLHERLPTTRLERFSIQGGMSEPLWRALERLPNLRHLTCSTGRDLAKTLGRVVRLEGLEHLALHTSMPSTEELRSLRALPRLRRLVISGVGDGSTHRADLAAAQQAVGPDVDLIVR